MNITEEVVRFQSRYMRTLTSKLVLNEYGLPTGFWDTSKILAHPPGEGEEPDDSCWVPLAYGEGYPVLTQTATAFWEHLPGEPLQHFEYFAKYLLMEGARNIQELAAIISQKGGGRAITPLVLQSIFDLYYWDLRAKAFDLFQEASLTRFRSVRGKMIEYDHLLMATDLVEKCKAYINSKFDDFSPREVLEVLKLSVSLQRLSVRLPTKTTQKIEDVHDGPVDIRAVIQDHSNHYHIGESASGSQDLLEMALATPETAEAAQRFALKLLNAPVNAQEVPGARARRATTTLASDPDKVAEDILAGERL